MQKEEEEATKKAMETQAIADDAQKDLNEAIPTLVSSDWFSPPLVNLFKFKSSA